MKNLFVFGLLAVLAACATCREHPIACGVVSAIAVGSVAATIEQNQPDRRSASFQPLCAPNCAVSR